MLVIASVVPLVCMGVFREYLDYRADRDRVYESLLVTARGTAVSVERDLQLRVSALETLATSPALQADDLAGFDKQAEAFLARQPPGSIMALAGPDQRRLRAYGSPAVFREPMRLRESFTEGAKLFETRSPIVTNIHLGRITGLKGFSVEVPVFHDGRVAYDLYIRLLPASIHDLIAGQQLFQGAILTVVDTAGAVVARSPGQDRFVGSPIVPPLWDAVRSNTAGVVRAPTLEGTPAIAAYSHVKQVGWAVVVGAPEEVVFRPLRAAILREAGLGAVMLAAGLLLALFASRGIMRPIEQLRRLAAHDDEIDPAGPAKTGLPEADMVAQALVTAAAGRQAAAKALAESEARFRALFELSPSGAILLDPETARVVDSNAAAAGYTGYSVAEFRGRLITEFSFQTGPERIWELCRSVAAGSRLRYETRINGRLGPRDLLVAIAPLQVADRTLMLINQIDITDLRRAEAGLRVNEERLELAREGANLGIWDWDIVNDTLSWSEHQWYLHGLEPRADGLSPESWRQVVHPADLQRAQAGLVAALKSPDCRYTSEYSVVLPDGSNRRLFGRGQTIRDANGRAVRMVGINMDVTARYEAELARDRLIWMLETERGRLTEIIEALPIGVGIIDTESRVVLGNAVMKRLHGPVNQAEAEASGGEWIAADQGGNRLTLENFPIQRALRFGETTLPGVEFLFRDSDGKENWYRVGAVPLRWDDGQVQEALTIFVDINAEKRLLDIQQRINTALEQRVRDEMTAREAAQQRAAHAERMHALGQIAGGIAHDFNNVLQAVSGGATLIERHPQDADRVLRNARMVSDAARRGAAITSRLLTFSRRGDLRAENVDVGALLADMADVLTHTLGGSVVCKLDVPIDLPPLVADRGQLETVLVNLATNARDAMPAGGTLTLAADTEIVSAGVPHPAALAAGGYVRIAVSDTGSGMDRAVLARVTEPFFTTKQPGKGTGLGLAMAKGFVEQSGGSLSIDSLIGRGTCIILWLPSGAAVAKSSTPHEDEAKHIGPDKPCVLLVDDDAIVRDVLTLSLQDYGYVVLAMESGHAALIGLETRQRVDIIVSDLTMPGMDGLTLIRAAQERRPGLPALLLTGYAGDGAALAVGGAISGAFSLLRKPVSGSQLVDRIGALLASTKQTCGPNLALGPRPVR